MARRVRLACALVALFALAPPRVASVGSVGAPSLIFWAWERPEDLRALPRDAGVAFLAQTLIVSGGRVTVQPRRQPLRVDPVTPLVAVTRIETAAAEPLGTSTDIDEVAGRIARTAALRRVGGIQVDFDARESERPAYRALLHALRRRLSPAAPLSITALASWCAEPESWLRGLPIDEAVPMLFRMGPIDRPFVRLAASDSWPARECRGTIGTSLDEPIGAPPRARRAYVFSPTPWSPSLVADARRLGGSWWRE